MAKTRRKGRVRGKIDTLPNDIKMCVDGMLADVRYTYAEISEYLAEQGYEVSMMSVFRYAQRSASAARRLMEAQEQTKAIIEICKKNPDADYTEGALQIIASNLTQKIAGAQDEFDNMPIDKAVSALISLSRTKSYKDKVYSALEEKVKLALDEFKMQIFNEITETDPLLAERLERFAEDFVSKVQEDKNNDF